ncbi:hypothetical protein QP162_08365 [Sphingomonas aurantiaca]|uniref:hypothetical protein n=1 Tax=Sphingomonas aurantiaca TaxID=185949 RepID=UPI002FDF427A
MSHKAEVRYPYRPITDRADYDWPEGKRLAIYLGVNHEVFDFGGSLGAELAPSQTDPDVMNYAWRDYGNRVGAWRLFDLFDRLDLRTTALLNADILDRCPGLAEACRDRGDEIAAHGRTNAVAQGTMSLSDERSMIADVTQRLATLGVRPTGWLGPGSRKATIRPTCSPKRGIAMCWTGRMTISRPASPPRTAACCRSPIRRRSTTCPP